MQSRISYLVVGAGPTGLGAAFRLHDLGQSDYLVVDAAHHPGGLAASFTDRKGFVWDIGGHVQFSHYSYFDEAMDLVIPEDGWLQHERESWIWIRDRFVPYPFQNNIRYLPREDMLSCVKGAFAAWKEEKSNPANFSEWIDQVFGAGIASLFMLPYNFKVWAYPPELLSHRWIGERVAVIDLERIVENILLERDDVSWGPNNKFRFPLHGGTGSIWRAMALRVGVDKLRFGNALVRINATKRVASFADGSQIAFKHLLSTIPLDCFAQIVEELPKEVKQEARQLKHSSSNIVGIGVRGRPPYGINKKCWMYFPEDNCPFYRVTVFSNYSPNNVPDSSRYYSLMCETSESEHKPVEHKRLVRDTVAGLYNTGLLRKPAHLADIWVYRALYGYPTPTLDRDLILGLVIPELDRLELFSRGRFGGWKYEVSNQDHSFMQGVEWADLVCSGRREKTYTVLPASQLSPRALGKSLAA